VSLKGVLDIASADGVADAIVAVAGATSSWIYRALGSWTPPVSRLVMARRRILAEGEGQLVVTRPTEIVRSALEIVGLSAWIVEWSNDWDE
jgi:hypothetical protein